MSTRKFIYWRPEMEQEEAKDGKMIANVHLLVGYSKGSFTDFQNMVDDLRKTFPEATDEKIFLAKVIKSSFFKGYSIIIWNARIKVRNYPNWVERDIQKMDYLW